MADTVYDIAVIGGGHNGLVCATYLAKAGKRVIVLEANSKVGGAAVTKELSYGKQVPACAHFLNQLSPLVEKELGLAEKGLTLAATDLKTIALDSAGRHLTIQGSDAQGDGINEAEQQAFKKLVDSMKRYAGTLKFLMDQPPINIFSPDFNDKLNALKLGWKLRFGLGAEDMSEFLRQVGMNIFDVLDDNLTDPRLKGAIAFDAVLGTHTGPRSPGTVFTWLYRLAGGEEAAIHQPEGGMGAVVDTIAKAATEAGVFIKTNAPVARVTVNDCAVAGVVLEGGEEIKAAQVVSNADPKTTVLDIVGARHFEADFVHRMSHVRMRGNAAKLHLSLSRLPKFTGLSDSDLGNRLVIAPDQMAVERAFNHAKYKETSAQPMMEISFPSVADSSLTDKGHVMSAIVQYAPHDLKGGWSEAATTEFLEVCLDRLAVYAPDIRDCIEHAELVSPTDLEAQFGMKGGNWHHGELTLDQMMMLRPVPQASRYAMPLDGLYLCGAGAHPGGGVMGTAGRNAAKAILKGEKA